MSKKCQKVSLSGGGGGGGGAAAGGAGGGGVCLANNRGLHSLNELMPVIMNN